MHSRAAAALAGLVLVGAACSHRSPSSPDLPATPPGSVTSAVSTSSGTGASSSAAAAGAGSDWTMYHGDPARSGVAHGMPAVRTVQVMANIRLDGAVYASPLVVGGQVIVATENDSVYGLDRSGRELWHQHLGEPATGDELPCGNIDPLGITGTPIAADGVVYLAAEYGRPPRHELVAIDLASHAVKWRRSLDLAGVETKAMQERGALAITGGRVWVPFGGLNGDCGGYKGRVVGYRLDGTGDPISYTVPTTREAGIWTPPGPSVAANGDLFVSVGNGESGPGDPYDHSDSVLRLNPQAKLVDSFSPSTWPTDNAADLDLGSQGPALVGTKWVVIAGKSGAAYVLRQGDLGGIGGEVSQRDLCRSFGGTAVEGDTVYLPCTDGVRAVQVGSTGQLQPRWQADSEIAGSPVVAGGRVWAVAQDEHTLHALDPATGKSRAEVQVGAVSRFATPAISDDLVLVPTLSGVVYVRTG
jgi:outer membrane protein assembly factor BamB